MVIVLIFFFKQKTAYERRISDWSSDVCSSDLDEVARYLFRRVVSWGRSSNVFLANGARLYLDVGSHPEYATPECDDLVDLVTHDKAGERILEQLVGSAEQRLREERSEEHTSELQSLMRISYAVFCLKKKQKLRHKNDRQHAT